MGLRLVLLLIVHVAVIGHHNLQCDRQPYVAALLRPAGGRFNAAVLNWTAAATWTQGLILRGVSRLRHSGIQ